MSETSEAAPVRPRWRRVGQFALGYLLGLIGLPLALGAVVFAYVVLRVQFAPPPKPETTVTTYVTSGAELSRRGATTLVWRRPDEVLRQTCRGVCDDLAFRYEPKPRLAEADGAVGEDATAWLRHVEAPLP